MIKLFTLKKEKEDASARAAATGGNGKQHSSAELRAMKGVFSLVFFVRPMIKQSSESRLDPIINYVPVFASSLSLKYHVTLQNHTLLTTSLSA